MKFIYGQESYLINKEIKNITSTFDGEAIFYDDDYSLQQVMKEINTIGLFSTKKLIILKGDTFIKDKKNHEEFIESLKNKSDFVEVVFVIYKDTIDQKIELLKFLKENAKMIRKDIIKRRDLAPIIKDIVTSKSGTIESIATINLSNRLPLNLYIVLQEVEKLLTLDKHITNDMVDKNIEKYEGENAFELVNAIVEHDVETIISNINKRIKENQSSIYIISHIVNTLSLAKLVNSYLKSSYSEKQIAEELKIHPFRIKKSKELINNVQLNKVDAFLKKMIDIETKVKTGQMPEEIAINVLLTSLIR